MTSVKSLRTLTLDIPPSCVEFVPGHPELFVVGTYFLEKTDDEPGTAADPTAGQQQQQRTGSLLLFRLEGDEVTLHHTLSTPFAVFDIHFSPFPTATTPSTIPLLAAATSTGSLALYQVSASSLSIAELSEHQLFPTTSLITHFAWHPTIPSLVALALSTGSIYLCDIATRASRDNHSPDPTENDDSDDPTLAHLHTHALEAWFVAFTPDGMGLLSGGDDSTLASLSLPPLPAASTSSPPRSPAERLLSALAAGPPPAPLWQDRRTHQAGVTAILPLAPPSPPSSPPSVPSSGAEKGGEGGEGNARQPPPVLALTGSYDDHVRLLALPPGSSAVPGPRRPTPLAELDLGGGVWRLKDITHLAPSPASSSSPAAARHHGQREHVILASCMHAGARVLRLSRGRRVGDGDNVDEAAAAGEGEWSFDVLAAFEEHRSMNYASDARPSGGVEGDAGVTVVSTSFYDRLLAVWRW